jgi:hypothetical protein
LPSLLHFGNAVGETDGIVGEVEVVGVSLIFVVEEGLNFDVFSVGTTPFVVVVVNCSGIVSLGSSGVE